MCPGRGKMFPVSSNLETEQITKTAARELAPCTVHGAPASAYRYRHGGT
jgi:hypothetical protein